MPEKPLAFGTCLLAGQGENPGEDRGAVLPENVFAGKRLCRVTENLRTVPSEEVQKRKISSAGAAKHLTEEITYVREQMPSTFFRVLQKEEQACRTCSP